ncbi:MAG: PLP-dependent cysteine synthase family protein [Myxococcota bacterium]
MGGWESDAIRAIESDFRRSADTHLIRLQLPILPGITLYLKDESTHPTGSLKHRLARSLFLYGLCNGWIREGTTIVESSSGSTAVSEAYFARLLGLPFIAVMPSGTSQQKIDDIGFYGGRCHFVDEAGQIYEAARALAHELNGHYMDQFTYAERATDWRGNNNIAESIFDQMKEEPLPIPHWVVVSPGTGGTSTTIGRYIRYLCHETKLCVADPENSVFYDHFRGEPVQACPRSNIEGIGRPRVEPSFSPSVIDRMIKVPDAAAFAAIRVLERLLNRRVGGSTGTNFVAACQLMEEMAASGERGSVVTLLCDGGERYASTYYDEEWLTENGFDIAPHLERIQGFINTGRMG